MYRVHYKAELAATSLIDRSPIINVPKGRPSKVLKLMSGPTSDQLQNKHIETKLIYLHFIFFSSAGARDRMIAVAEVVDK